MHVLLLPDFRGPVHLPKDCHWVRLSPGLTRRWTSLPVPPPEPRPLYWCEVMGFVGDAEGWDQQGEEEQSGFDNLQLETSRGTVTLGLSGEEEVSGPKGSEQGGTFVYVHVTWLQENEGD